MTFGPTLPTPKYDLNYTILLQSDSLTSTWKLQEEQGKSPIMSFILEEMLSCSEYNRLKSAIFIGHTFGEGNPLADNLSRGDLKLFHLTCEILQVTPKRLEMPPAFPNIMRRVCEFAKTMPPRAP